MSDLINKIEDYSETLSPDSKQKDSMYIKVFNQDPDTKFSWRSNWFGSPAALVMYATLFIFGAPLLYSSGLSTAINESDNTISGGGFLNTVLRESSPEAKNSLGYFDEYGSADREADYKYSKILEGESEGLGISQNRMYAQPAQYLLEDDSTSQRDRVIERDGSLILEALDPKSIFADIKSLVSQHGGYIVSSNFRIENDQNIGRIQMRIPVDKFDLFLELINDMPLEVVGENINLTDRQNEYAQQLELVGGHEQTIEELQKELTRKDLTKNERAAIKAKIELEKKYLEGNQNRLEEIKSETDLSTLNIEVHNIEGFSVLGREWRSTGEIMQYMLSFWGQIIILATPLGVVAGIIFRKRIFGWFKRNLRGRIGFKRD